MPTPKRVPLLIWTKLWTQEAAASEEEAAVVGWDLTAAVAVAIIDR